MNYEYEVEAKRGERTGREVTAPRHAARLSRKIPTKKTLCLSHKTAMRCANIKQAAKVNLGSVWVVHGWGEAKMGILCLGRQ